MRRRGGGRKRGERGRGGELPFAEWKVEGGREEKRKELEGKGGE